MVICRSKTCCILYLFETFFLFSDCLKSKKHVCNCMDFFAFYDCSKSKIPRPPFNPRCVKSSSDTLAITPIIYLELVAEERFSEGKITPAIRKKKK